MICKFLKTNGFCTKMPSIEFGGKVSLYMPWGWEFTDWLEKNNSKKNISVGLSEIRVKPGAIVDIHMGLIPGLPEDYYLLPTWLRDPNNFALIGNKAYGNPPEGIILKVVNITKKVQVIKFKEPFIDMLVYKAKKVKMKTPKEIITYDGLSYNEFKSKLEEKDAEETTDKSDL